MHTLSRIHAAGHRLYLQSAVAATLAALSMDASAADLKSLIGRWTENLKSLGPFLVIVFSIIGLACIGIGIHRFINARKTQSSVMEGVLYTVSGSLLLSLVAFSSLLSGTSFGSNAASDGLNSLGIG